MKNCQFPQQRRLTKVCAALLLMQSLNSFAVSTDIADVPMAVKNSAKPNIMFILDNSGSMEWRSITGLDATSEYSTAYAGFFSSSVNQLYYNPNTRYTPGIGKSSFTSTTPEGVALADATTTSTGALNDPYLSPTSGRTDLTKTCYYSSTTPPLVPLSSNCSTSSTGSYTKGPIAFTAYYYDYTGAGTPTTTSAASNFTRRDILRDSAPFTRSTSRTDCTVSTSTASCTRAQELQNFANWFSYYRTRMLTMKTTMGQAFAGLSDKYRLGFSTINDGTNAGNSGGANFISIGDFDVTKKTSWFTQLYSIDPNNGTPLQKALARVGEYYSGNGMGYSSGGTDDPVQYSCQANYAILSTDGFWNSLSGGNTVAVGNADLTVPTVPTSNLDPAPVTGVTAGANWPRPYYEGPTPSSNSVADVSAYYWIKDLRPGMTNNVPVSSADKASWQHMTTFTIGLGADGSKDYVENYLTASSGFYSDVVSGADNWPVPAADTNKAIDDLWHAAVNGHGQYFSAKNPTNLRESLRKVLDDIVSRTGAAAAVAVASADLSSDNTSYASKYNSANWTGNLLSYEIDPDTGEIDTESPNWSAQEQLDAVSVTADSRRIVTSTGNAVTSANPTQGVQFRPAGSSYTTKLSAAQQALLNSTVTPPGPSDGAAVLAFLRGERSAEGTDYRTRGSRLGDIVNAEAVIVGSPSMKYNDDGYSAFKANQLTTKASPTRLTTIFQGANDGMLHAFRADNGQESWAYIPNLLFDVPSKLRDLSKMNNFSHKFYVDSTPLAADVDFSNTCPDAGCPLPTTLPSPDWRTVLIGGLGKGGRGYYALDVTTPTASSEADAVSKVLWEFPNSATAGTVVSLTTPTGTTAEAFTMAVNKIGYTFGLPLVVKTRAHGWVALVTSGYNNGSDTGGDGHGYLFVLNARTGKLLHAFDTGVGDSGATNGPSGLAQISAFVTTVNYDETAEYVYGGDLLGNVWRFDLNNSDSSQWKLKRLAQLVDAGSPAKPQPVTTYPELARVSVAGSLKRFVYVGTGLYFGDSDITGSAGANAHAGQTQTMYGLVDDLSNPTGATAVITPLRSNLVQQTLTDSVTNERVTSSNPVSYATKKGWYVDMPETGERINTSPVLALGSLVFTSNIPTSDVCSPGGSSWLNILDYKTGSIVTGLTSSSWFLGNVLASRAIVVQSGSKTWSVIQGGGGDPLSKMGPPTGALSASRRVSWREVLFDE